MPASETSATEPPRASRASTSGTRRASLCACSETRGVAIPKRAQSTRRVPRVLAGDQLDLAQHPQRARRQVLEIPDRRRDHVDGPAPGYGHAPHPAPRQPHDRRESATPRATRARAAPGEALAAAHLRASGFRILARNVHLRHAEIDLVALDGAALGIVEVRLRTSDRFGSAASRSTRASSGASSRAARAARARRPAAPRAVRFDVVAIDAATDPPRIEHLRDAFNSSS